MPSEMIKDGIDQEGLYVGIDEQIKPQPKLVSKSLVSHVTLGYQFFLSG